MTVDEILATGKYTDRQGREWHLCRHGGFACMRWHNGHPSRGLEPGEMRLLIERDQHRGDCPGLRYCESHPVPHVARGGERGFEVWGSGDITDDMPEDFSTLPAAMSAARALAVGE